MEKFKDHTKIVLIHWGLEQMGMPMPGQRVLARKMIDAGADLIIGSHPHVVQGYEKYRGKYIFYSLGNLLFPNYTLSTSKGNFGYVNTRKMRHSIVPLFDVNQGRVVLERIICTKNYGGIISRRNGVLFLLNLPLILPGYKFVYGVYVKSKGICEFLHAVPRKIQRFLGKI